MDDSHSPRLATAAQDFAALLGAIAARGSSRVQPDRAKEPAPAPSLDIVRVADETRSVEKLDRTTLRPADAAGAALRGYRLLVIGEHQHTAHRLPVEGSVSLGRSDAADIQVQDPLMSRVHATVHVTPTLSVSDLGSSNGTIVRGSRIEANTLTSISVGDTIEVGATVLIVQPDFSRRRPAQQPEPEHTGDHKDPSTEETPMDRVHKLARRIAKSQINVLLLGETGVGKEVMARTIHGYSQRSEAPFLGLNCASLNEQLFESELFGYEKGAFTGATNSKTGLIESADGGTVFLDEVGEMPLSAQAKLLRVLEERQVMRVGSLRPRDIDVRFIAATNQNLDKEIELGKFREDLFYRLNGISLVIPPLRERPEEIPQLARTFIDEATRAAGFAAQPTLGRDAVAWMQQHTWPGNIRELRNAVNRAVLLATNGVIEPDHLQTDNYQPRSGRGSGRSPVAQEPAAPAPAAPVPAGADPAFEAERQRVLDALAACGGNQTRAAKMLGIARRTLTTKLDKFGIPRPRKDR